jgi:hypothetical protein
MDSFMLETFYCCLVVFAVEVYLKEGPSPTTAMVSMCPPNFMCWKLNLQIYTLVAFELGEVIWIREGHQNGAFIVELVAF